jgi:hypothetical protein
MSGALALARSLIRTNESSDTILMCLADLDDALLRADDEFECQRAISRTIRLYTDERQIRRDEFKIARAATREVWSRRDIKERV